MGNEYGLNLEIKLSCMSGWNVESLKEKGVMNGSVHRGPSGGRHIGFGCHSRHGLGW